MKVRGQGILVKGQTGTPENLQNEHSVARRSGKNGQLKWRMCVGEEKKVGLPGKARAFESQAVESGGGGVL